tara:strand:- start:546 stop:1724 length:1179 start_codon:yes stop_codon:yes gene_type:complete
MKKYSTEIYNTIKSITNKGPKELHAPFFTEHEKYFLNKCINTGVVSTIGNFVNIFEKKISKVTRSKFTVAVNSGTSALHLSLIAANLKKNEEVLMPAFNFIANANAVSYLGGIPHFVDIEKESLGVDPIKLEHYLQRVLKKKGEEYFNKNSGRKIKILMVTHIFGHSAKIKEIKKLAKKFNFIVIEDASEALGSFNDKKHLGTFGDIGVLSFNGNKIITTGGGGAILTNNKKYFKKIKSLSTVCKIQHQWNYNYHDVGYNYRMPNINAALGLAQLKNLKNLLSSKRKLFKLYNKKIKNLSWVSLLNEPKKCKSNFWLQTLIISKKNKSLLEFIISYVNKKGIQARPVWNLINLNKPYKYCPSMNLKNSIEMKERTFNIPSSAGIILIKNERK